MTDPIVRVLHVAPQDAVTALVRHRGALCVTRFFATPVPRALDAAVAAYVAGASAELPPALAARLDGYRVRAGLGGFAGIPAVVAGGVRRVKLTGLAPLAGAFGNAFVTVSAHAGSPLPEVVAQLSSEARTAVLAAIVPIVARLHARGVAHGALGAAAFAAADAAVTLVELAPLRAADPATIAADRAAIAELATWLLGAPAELDVLWSAPAPPADGTVIVPDDETMIVPDD